MRVKDKKEKEKEEKKKKKIKKLTKEEIAKELKRYEIKNNETKKNNSDNDNEVETKCKKAVSLADIRRWKKMAKKRKNIIPRNGKEKIENISEEKIKETNNKIAKLHCNKPYSHKRLKKFNTFLRLRRMKIRAVENVMEKAYDRRMDNKFSQDDYNDFDNSPRERIISQKNASIKNENENNSSLQNIDYLIDEMAHYQCYFYNYDVINFILFNVFFVFYCFNGLNLFLTHGKIIDNKIIIFFSWYQQIITVIKNICQSLPIICRHYHHQSITCSFLYLFVLLAPLLLIVLSMGLLYYNSDKDNPDQKGKELMFIDKKQKNELYHLLFSYYGAIIEQEQLIKNNLPKNNLLRKPMMKIIC